MLFFNENDRHCLDFIRTTPRPRLFIFLRVFLMATLHQPSKKKMVSKTNPFTKLTKKTLGFSNVFFVSLVFVTMSPTSSLGVATVRWNHAAPLSRSQQRSRRHGDAEWRAGGLPPEKDFFRPKKIQRFFLYLDVSLNGGFSPQNTPKWSFLMGWYIFRGYVKLPEGMYI